MIAFNKLVLASNNQGKLDELQRLFEQAGLAIQVIPQATLGIEDAIEDGLSFVENALIKARHASRASGLPAIADDSGLCVPCLKGRPGIYSARFAHDYPNYASHKDAANNQKLLESLLPFRDTAGTAITGQFVCVLALVRHADDPLPLLAQGVWHGEILPAERGEHGFGYDPLFWLPSLGKSASELSKDEKNRLSHRGQAMQQLIAQLDKL